MTPKSETHSRKKDEFEPPTFGTVLRIVRLRRGYGQREYARAIGMNGGNYSKFENDVMVPPNNKDKIIKLVKGLNPSLEEIESLCIQAYDYHSKKVWEKFFK